MYTLILPDRETALLVLFYAKRGAEEASKTSLIEAPRIAGVVDGILDEIVK